MIGNGSVEGLYMQTSTNRSTPHSPSLGASAAASLVMILLLGVGANYLNARKHYVSFGRDFHMCLDGRGLSFFSDARCGPYRGSIIGLAGNPDPIASASNFPFYYRHFRWANGQVLWTLSIMLPLVLLPFTVCPAIWLWQQIRRRTSGA